MSHSGVQGRETTLPGTCNTEKGAEAFAVILEGNKGVNWQLKKRKKRSEMDEEKERAGVMARKERERRGGQQEG